MYIPLFLGTRYGDSPEHKFLENLDCILSLVDADIVVALLTGRDVDSGTAAEVGYSYAKGKELVGVNANNVKPINNFTWGLFEFGKNIVEDLEGLKKYLDSKN